MLAGVQAPIAYAGRRGCWPGARGTQSCALSLRGARWQMVALQAHFDRDRGAGFDDPAEMRRSLAAPWR